MLDLFKSDIYPCVQGGSQICFHVHFTTNISIYGLLCISVKNWCTAIKMPFCISAQSTFHRFNKLKTGTNTLLYNKLTWRLWCEVQSRCCSRFSCLPSSTWFKLMLYMIYDDSSVSIHHVPWSVLINFPPSTVTKLLNLYISINSIMYSLTQLSITCIFVYISSCTLFCFNQLPLLALLANYSNCLPFNSDYARQCRWKVTHSWR